MAADHVGWQEGIVNAPWWLLAKLSTARGSFSAEKERDDAGDF